MDTVKVSILAMMLGYCFLLPFHLVLVTVIAALPRDHGKRTTAYFVSGIVLGLVLYGGCAFLIIMAAKKFGADDVLKKFWIPAFIMFVVMIVFMVFVTNILENRVCAMPNATFMSQVAVMLGFFNLIILAMFLALNSFKIDLFGALFKRVGMLAKKRIFLSGKGRDIYDLIMNMYDICTKYVDLNKKSSGTIASGAATATTSSSSTAAATAGSVAPSDSDDDDAHCTSEKEKLATMLTQFFASLINTYDRTEFMELLNLHIQDFTRQMQELRNSKKFTAIDTKLQELEANHKKLLEQGLKDGYIQNEIDIEDTPIVMDFEKLPSQAGVTNDIENKNAEIEKLTKKYDFFREWLELYIRYDKLPSSDPGKKADSVSRHELTAPDVGLKGPFTKSRCEAEMSSLQKELSSLKSILKELTSKQASEKKSYEQFVRLFNANIEKYKKVKDGDDDKKKKGKGGLQFENFCYNTSKSQIDLFEQLLSTLNKIKTMNDEEPTLFDAYVLYSLKKDDDALGH